MRSLPILLLVAAGAASAGTIKSVEIDLGNWNGSSFSISNHQWNTYGGWAAIGITDPVLGDSLLNTSTSSDLGLSDGSYYLYMSDYGNSFQAIQFIVDYEGGGVDTTVYTDPGGASDDVADGYTLVSGTGTAASLLLAGQSTYELVGGNAQTYAPNGYNNWVVAFNTDSGPATPEPASWLLFATGAAAAWLGRRRRSAPIV